MSLHAGGLVASVIGFAGWLLLDFPVLGRHAFWRLAVQVISAGLLAWALLWTTITRTPWLVSWAIRGLGGGLAAMGAGLLFYSAVLEIPLRQRRQEPRGGKLVTSGTYALCRHPAALWLALFLLGWFAAFPSPEVGQLALVWVLLELVVVWVQDRWIFPRELPGYTAYKQKTPFLLPTRASLRTALRRERRGA